MAALVALARRNLEEVARPFWLVDAGGLGLGGPPLGAAEVGLRTLLLLGERNADAGERNADGGFENGRNGRTG